MDFYVFDNDYTYQKIFPAAHRNPLTKIPIEQVAITTKGAFWFETNMNRENHNVNINSPYVHIHKGIRSINQMQFDKDPTFIYMKDVIYNPNLHRIEIYKPGRIWPWSKPIWVKNTKGKYYGTEDPLKKIKTLGNWFYDYSNDRIIITLNYYQSTR